MKATSEVVQEWAAAYNQRDAHRLQVLQDVLFSYLEAI